MHVGTAGTAYIYEAKPVHNEEKKKPQSKYGQKYPHSLALTHTHTYVEIFLSLCSAAISSLSVNLLF